MSFTPNPFLKRISLYFVMFHLHPHVLAVISVQPGIHYGAAGLLRGSESNVHSRRSLGDLGRAGRLLRFFNKNNAFLGKRELKFLLQNIF